MRFSRREAKGTHREMGQGESRVAAMCRYGGIRVQMEQVRRLHKCPAQKDKVHRIPGTSERRDVDSQRV